MLKQGELEKLTQKIKLVARQAGNYALSKKNSAQRTVEKEAGDYATDADVETEEIIIKSLKEIDKSIAVYAEESHVKPESGLYWVVDPIDGTKNYFRGQPTWSVNIALYDSGKKQILLGVVYFPAWNDLFDAYLGGGARKNEKPIMCSSIDNLEEAVLYAELPTKSRSSEQDFTKFEEILKESYRTRGWGLASALCYTANGAFDAHLDFSGTTKPFDIYAPLIIATEAGCEVIGFENDEVPIGRDPSPLIVGNEKILKKLN